MAKLGMHVLFLLVVMVALISAMPRPDDDEHHFVIHVPHHIHKHIHTHVKKVYIPIKKEEHSYKGHENHHDW